MCDKDGMAHNQEKEICEGDINHIRAIPQESSTQIQKNKYTREHNKTVWKPNSGRQRFDLYWNQVWNTNRWHENYYTI